METRYPELEQLKIKQVTPVLFFHRCEKCGKFVSLKWLNYSNFCHDCDNKLNSKIIK